MGLCGEETSEFVSGLILSVFEKEGPTAVYWYPEELAPETRFNIAMKSISLLMGDETYQRGGDSEKIKYYGILPYPDESLTCLTYFFLIPDNASRGRAKAATITILAKNNKDQFLYKNIKSLVLFLNQVSFLITADIQKEAIDVIMNEFKQKIINFANRIHFIPSQEKTLKIIFSGLDAAGKTSIRYALDSKESQLNLNNPTIGIERNTRQIGNFINVIEWDCGGQEKYRAQFLRRAENYLDETDGLFYVIDVKKPESYKESVEYLKKNIEFLRQINRYIPIAILLHKFDPNLEMSEEMIRGIVKIKEEIAEIEPEFHVMVFETSIFNPKTLWNAYSMLFSHISPNRDILKEQIKRFCNENNMVGMVVIHEDRIIISRYITDRYETMFSDEFIYSYVSLFKTLNEYDYAQYQKYGVEFENFVIKYFSIEGSEKNYSILLILDNAVKSINDFNADQIRFDIKNKIDGLIQAYH